MYNCKYQRSVHELNKPQSGQEFLQCLIKSTVVFEQTLIALIKLIDIGNVL